jgi:hypothetical protein
VHNMMRMESQPASTASSTPSEGGGEGGRLVGERVGAPKGAPTRFRDMPPLEYVAGNVANVLNTSHWASESHRISKQAAAEGMVNALRLPDERKKEAARVLYEATHGPPDKFLALEFYAHLQTLSRQATDKIAALEKMFETDAYDTESLQALAHRDMGLNLGVHARGMFEHAEARRTIIEAADGVSALQGRRYHISK